MQHGTSICSMYIHSSPYQRTLSVMSEMGPPPLPLFSPLLLSLLSLLQLTTSKLSLFFQYSSLLSHLSYAYLLCIRSLLNSLLQPSKPFSYTFNALASLFYNLINPSFTFNALLSSNLLTKPFSYLQCASYSLLQPYKLFSYLPLLPAIRFSLLQPS